MSVSILGMIAVIALSVLVFGLMIVGAVFVIRDTVRQRGNWGVNLKPGSCRQCGTPMPAFRKPANRRQVLWGGWTCAECGLEVDKWGHSVEGQVPGKWAVLRAVEEASNRERPRPSSDERVRNDNEQLKRRKKP